MKVLKLWLCLKGFLSWVARLYGVHMARLLLKLGEGCQS